MILLDSSFAPSSLPFDDFTSLVWEERFFETGTFTVHTFASPERMRELSSAVYVTDGGRFGRIDYIRAENGECEFGGHMTEALLDDRLLNGEFSGNVTSAVCEAVGANLRGLDIAVAEDQPELEGSITVSSDHMKLGKRIHEILRPYGASFTVRLEENGLVFRIVKGRETGVVFNSSSGSLSSVSLKTDRSSFCNVVTVEGADGTTAVTDLSGGGEKREMYVKAPDITPASFQTNEEYTAALGVRGREICAEHSGVFDAETQLTPGTVPAYGTDCRPGDICEVSYESLGLSFRCRITGADIVTENGVTLVYPILKKET